MNFAIFLLCTITAQVVLSLPAKQTREPERFDDDFKGNDDKFDRNGGRRDHDGDKFRDGSESRDGSEDFKPHQGRDGFRHPQERKEFDRHDGSDRFEHREQGFFHSTPRSNIEDDAVITVTYVGYNTTSAATEEPTSAVTEVGTESATTESATETMEPGKSESENANAETQDTDNESSLVDLDLALLKNNQINKIVKNQLNQAAKQSGLLGAIETAPGVEGTGSLTGGLGGLTGGLSGLTGGLSGLTGVLGGLGLPGVPGVGGAGDLVNNAQNVAENTSSQVKKLLEIDLNQKSLLAI